MENEYYDFKLRCYNFRKELYCDITISENFCKQYKISKGFYTKCYNKPETFIFNIVDDKFILTIDKCKAKDNNDNNFEELGFKFKCNVLLKSLYKNLIMLEDQIYLVDHETVINNHDFLTLVFNIKNNFNIDLNDLIYKKEDEINI